MVKIFLAKFLPRRKRGKEVKKDDRKYSNWGKYSDRIDVRWDFAVYLLLRMRKHQQDKKDTELEDVLRG